MAYGTLKVDNITFTNSGVDQTITVSGIVRSISGNITVTGTVQAQTVIGVTVSGGTVTGDAGAFGTLTGNTAGFTTITGTTVTGTTANFVSGIFTGAVSGTVVRGSTVSGAVVTGDVGQFTVITGSTAGFTTVTGATVTGTTANFVNGSFSNQISGATVRGTVVSGATVTGDSGQFTTLTGVTAGFSTVTGTTVTGTNANFVNGLFSTQVSGTAVRGTTVSGTTVTGETAQFTAITGGTAGFITITGTTVTGTTANFVNGVFTNQVSGATVTGNTGRFTVLTGDTAGFTTVTGTTVTGTNANFVNGLFTTQVSGTTVRGTTVSGATVTGTAGQFGTLTGTTAGFTTVTGTTVTGSIANFVSGVFTTQISGATITGNLAQFTTLTGNTAGFTTVTGTTVTGTTANFATLSGTTITGGAVTVASGIYTGNVTAAAFIPTGSTAPTNGLYLSAANSVALSTNGNGRLFIDSSGNVGVGTASPASQVLGTTASRAIAVTGAAGGSVLVLQNDQGTVSTNARIELNGVSSGGNPRQISYIESLQTATSGAGALVFGTHSGAAVVAATERLRITSTGLVGIGTSAPAYGLEVNNQNIAITNRPSTGTDNPVLYLRRNVESGDASLVGTHGSLAFQTDYLVNGTFATSSSILAGSATGDNINTYFAFSTTNSGGTLGERMRLTSVGLGIGTTPDSILHVLGPGGIAGLRVGYNNTSVNYYDADTQIFRAANATERARIDSSGRLGIGTTSASGILHTKAATNQFIGEDSATGNIFAIQNTGGTTTLNSYLSTTGRAPIVFTQYTSECGRWDASGRLLVGTSTARSNFSYAFGNGPTQLQVEAAGAALPVISAVQNYDSGTTGAPAYLVLARAGSTAIGSNTVVATGNWLGEIDFSGSNGTNFIRAASIRGDVDTGTVSSTSMPGRLVFSTTADGAASPTERLRIDSTGQIEANSLGTAAAPTWTFVGDPDTGAFSPGANQFAISTGGTGRLFVDASGNIATGVATYSKPLTINNANAAIALRANSGGTYSDHGIFFAVDGTNYSQIYNDGIGQLIFRTGSALNERLRITSTGNVGIGTASPGSFDPNGNQLVVGNGLQNQGITIYGSPTTQSILYFADGTSGTQPYTGYVAYDHSADALRFGINGGTERFRCDSSGRLLVGTSSSLLSSSLLQVAGNSYPAMSINSFGTASNPEYFFRSARGTQSSPTVSVDGDKLGAIYFQGYDGAEYLVGAKIEGFVDGAVSGGGVDDLPGRLVFSTTADGAASPTERLRITSTGQVRLAGAGITFNGDTATANELDDYEEGTFTPEFRDGATGTAAPGYSQRTGKYTKIGNLVTYYIFLNDVTTTGLTAGNLVYITGLPFASVNLQFRDVPAVATCGSATPTTGAINFVVVYNQSYGVLVNGTTTGSTNFTVSQATSGAFDCNISGQYYVS